MGGGEIISFYSLPAEGEAAYQPPARTIQAPVGIVDDLLMAKAARLGVAVHAWTVNEQVEMERLLDLDVHGIITDDLALLVDVLADHR